MPLWPARPRGGSEWTRARGASRLAIVVLALSTAGFAAVSPLSAKSAAPKPITGTNKGDYLRGNSGANVIWGLGGGDRLIGYHGNDRLFGHRGNDYLLGGGGADVLVGGGGRDRSSEGPATTASIPATASPTTSPAVADATPSSRMPAISSPATANQPARLRPAVRLRRHRPLPPAPAPASSSATTTRAATAASAAIRAWDNPDVHGLILALRAADSAAGGQRPAAARGDALHQELHPTIERRCRAIAHRLRR